MKIRTALRDCIKTLDENNTNSSKVDSIILLGFVLNLKSNEITQNLDRMISDVDKKKLDHFLDRWIANEPVSKIIGRRLFWNATFFVNHQVLDPRPETEVLIEGVISNIKNRKTILDLGTGSGCLAVCLSLALKNVVVTASDISEEALSIAKKNAKKNMAKVSFIKSDWFENIRGRYDVIISNPPYINDNDFNKLSETVKRYDPKIALYGGSDGLVCYRAIAENMMDYLDKDGLGFFEIGLGQKLDVIDIFLTAGFVVFDVKQDFNGIDRVVCVKKDA